MKATHSVAIDSAIEPATDAATGPEVPQSAGSTEKLSLPARVHAAALACGFARAGIAPVFHPEDPRSHALADYFEHWVAAGHAADMDYLKRRDAEGRLLRGAIQVAAPWARSVILCAAPYGGGADLPLSTDPAPSSTGWIARYAWSGKRDADGNLVPSDYHRVLLRWLKAMEALLHGALGTFRSWAYVDAGPVVERAWAQAAGLGWVGKNTCVLSEELGSFFLLGTVLTDLELSQEQQAPVALDRCGSCTRCIDACPTGALIAPYRMDAGRCISYLTIEKRGPIELDLRAGMGRQIAGCDICQDVCPWNGRQRRMKPHWQDAEMQPRPELVNALLLELAALSREQWQRMFFGSPLSRVKYEGFRRNLAIAMGNSGDQSMLVCLRRWLEEPDATLREAAAWAVAQLLDGFGMSANKTSVTLS